MAGDELFGELPHQLRPVEEKRGAPRLREPVRNQIELRATELDSLIGEDHPARSFWSYVECVDLSALEARIKAREHTAGQPAISPRLMLALWLYAISEGVGSARALERLCESHDAYRWLCGGVSVNYHTLSDFRLGHADLLDRLLAEHLAALAQARLIDFSTLVQDGVRIRASAGASSFRREARLDQLLSTAQAVVDTLKGEVETRSDASNQRIKTAKERAARERCERIKTAQAALAQIKQQRNDRKKRNNGKPQKEPRASTTDPEARVMKMADGGFRPAYNVQVVSAADKQIIVDVKPYNNGSDRGLLRERLEAVCERGRQPSHYLADGGFNSAADIEWAHGKGIEVFCPPVQSKHGTDPFTPRRRDGPGVRAWRSRMGSEDGQAVYKVRALCECIHARWRHWNLRQVTVRGLQKVRTVMLWYALANNILQGHRLAAAQTS